jgi:hypothetical protein
VRIGHEKDCRQVSGERDREHTDNNRRRVEPTGHHIARRVAKRNAARSDSAQRRAEEKRRQDRGHREHRAEQPLPRQALCLVAEREPRSTQDDAQGRDAERNRQRSHDGGESRAERRPQQDQAEDQPHVVDLPHRSDRAIDEHARPRSSARVTGNEVPEAGSRVGAAEDGVEGHGHQEHRGHDIGQAHQGSLRSTGRASEAAVPFEWRTTTGPYGTG